MDEDTISASATTQSMSTNLLGFAVAAACLSMLLLFIVAVARRKEAKDAKEEPSLIEDDDDEGFNPMFDGQQESSKAVMVAALGLPSGLNQRSDLLWSNFRHATAFDHVYFGNELMMLTDGMLVDIYAIIGLRCPPVEFFGPLRGAGNRFLDQLPTIEEEDEFILDDAIDFLFRAMPDVLIERAIDMCALLCRYTEYDEEEVYGAFTRFVACI
jgi:hypothetical protein